MAQKKVFQRQNTNTKPQFTQLELDGLQIHNQYRRNHGVPDLKLNKGMCRHAQEWAEACAKSCIMNHRPNNKYGENMYYGYATNEAYAPKTSDAIKEWYGEIQKYKFGHEGVIPGTLHFTQLVWKSCTELGFGMAKNSKGETYFVANYHPPGNFVGKFVENVPRPKK